MAKETEYKKLMELGSWLNTYVNSLSQWNIDELADEALKLADVSYECGKNDPVIETIKKSLVPDCDTKSAQLILNLPKEAKFRIAERGYSDEENRMILNDIFVGINYPRFIRYFIQHQQLDVQAPWETILASQEDFMRESGQNHFFLEEYNNIREKLIIVDERIQVINEMVFPTTESETRWVRLPALISRIFVRFLQLGGSEYITLCKNCGIFILAERKGQRQFCSGRCRIAQKRKDDKALMRGEKSV